RARRVSPSSRRACPTRARPVCTIMSSTPTPLSMLSSKSNSRTCGHDERATRQPPRQGRHELCAGVRARHTHEGTVTMTTAANIILEVDGERVEAMPGETIWQVAQRHGAKIPHLCWHPSPGYRADGNCRACMVEIEGERVLAASCQRKATAGMKVKTASE